MGNTSYYYQTYVEGMDSLVFANEPYFTTDHVNKKLPLVESWCKMYNLDYNGEMPEIKYNPLQRKLQRIFFGQVGQIKTNYGDTNQWWYVSGTKTISVGKRYARGSCTKIVDHYADDYHIFQVTKPTSEILDGVEAIKDPMTNMELVSLLLHSDKRILIDSCMQHVAAALKMPSVVLWNGTSPKVFGWDMHTNIQAKKPAKCKLPNSVLFDFDFTGVEAEYPYVDEDDDIFDFDKIVEAVDKES